LTAPKAFVSHGGGLSRTGSHHKPRSQTNGIEEVAVLIPEKEAVNVTWCPDSMRAPIDSKGLSHSGVYIPEGMSKSISEPSSLETGNLSLPRIVAVITDPDFAVWITTLHGVVSIK
jgi:hypothetical protein